MIHTLARPLLAALATLALSLSPGASRAQDSTVDPAAFVAAAAEEEAYGIALEAFLYGYPRVEMARRIHNETNRIAPDQVISAPLNRFYYFERLAQPGDGAFIKAPNNDTLYASGYLDLSAGPVVLRIPQMGERLYVALVVDAAGRVVTRLSSVVSGAGGVDHAFVGPGFSGSLPADVRPIPVAANHVWLLMRVETDGTEADEALAVALLKQFRLAPLADRSALAEPEPPRTPIADLPVTEPLAPFDSLAFFHVLADMLAANPVPAEDRGLLARWQHIGLAPGRFDRDALSEPVRRGIERAMVAGDRIITAAQFGIAITVNGWNYSLVIGKTGADWALNAAIARGGYGNLADDSVYYQRNLDAAGGQLSGEEAYLLTFPPGQLPPVDAFWSITPYGMDNRDLIENDIRRYSIGDRTEGLVFGPDGSLTLILQRDTPTDPALRANWLPVGEGSFYLIMRTYAPRPEIVSGAWAPPNLHRRP